VRISRHCRDWSANWPRHSNGPSSGSTNWPRHNNGPSSGSTNWSRLSERTRAAAQRTGPRLRTEQRLNELAEAQTEQRLNELVEAQERLEQRLNELAEQTDRRFRELVEAQQRTEQRLTELAEQTDKRFARLEGRVDKIEVKLGRLDGRMLEVRYHQRAAAYFGRWLRRTVVVDGNEIVERVEGSLTTEELDQVLLTDLVVRGRAAHLPNRPEVWVAIEISAVIDGSDVQRAVQRAGLLRQAGVPALPAVAGDEATEHAESEAQNRGVVMLEDGSASFWDEALAAWPV
jgi:hypothetical protein